MLCADAIAISLDDIWKQVILPDLCQLEAGIKLRQEGAPDQMVPVCGTLLMVLADHNEVVKLAKIPGTFPDNFARQGGLDSSFRAEERVQPSCALLHETGPSQSLGIGSRLRQEGSLSFCVCLSQIFDRSFTETLSMCASSLDTLSITNESTRSCQRTSFTRCTRRSASLDVRYLFPDTFLSLLGSPLFALESMAHEPWVRYGSCWLHVFLQGNFKHHLSRVLSGHTATEIKRTHNPGIFLTSIDRAQSTSSSESLVLSGPAPSLRRLYGLHDRSKGHREG